MSSRVLRRWRSASRGGYPWLRADPALVPEAMVKLDRYLVAWRELLRDIDDELGTTLAAGLDPPGGPGAANRSGALGLASTGSGGGGGRAAPWAAIAERPASAGRPAPVGTPSGDLVAAALASARDALERFARIIGEHAGSPRAGAERDLLADADGRCRAELEEAAATVPVSGLRPWFELGVVPPGEPGDLGGDPDRLRVALETWGATDVAALLASYPGLADALCEPTVTNPPDVAVWPPEAVSPPVAVCPPGGVSPPADGAAPSGAATRSAASRRGGPADDGKSLRRVVAVRAALADRDPDEVRRWALLWPERIGNLDGAPPSLRFEANRLRLRHALAASLDADLRYDEEETRRRVAPGGRFAGARAALRGAWSSRDALSSVWSPAWMTQWQARMDARVRVRLLESLLHQVHDQGRREPAPSGQRLPPGGPPGRRQVLLFDLAGRGRLAELRGSLDASTEHLAVVVPGTGTALRGFHMPVWFARDLVAADPGGRVAALAWMGCDLPRAFANESPLARFALAGAPRLRDVVEALDPPSGADITVIGHSYGGALVGAAERLGLRVDKVVHLASAGAGPGVVRVEDYPAVDPLGRPRRVRRWSLTAPGDPMVWARRADLSGRVRRLAAGRHRLARLARLLHPGGAGRSAPGVAAFDLGVDPATLTGTTILGAGHWERDDGHHRAGEPVRGLSAHTAVTNPATAAFRAMTAVVMDR